MAWIESHQNLGRHPKTKAAARELGISRVQLVGHLHFLWWWALDFAEDGDLSKFETVDIAEEAMWEGEPDRFMNVLIATGFLTTDLQINDWQDYTGRLVAQRQSNRERQRRFRNKANGDETVTSHQSENAVAVTSPLRNGATVPNQTEPNQPDQTDGLSRESLGADAPNDAAPKLKPKPVRSVPQSRATSLPDDFEITDELIKWAAELGWTAPMVEFETEKFRDYWRGNGKTHVDWAAVWRNWIRRSSVSVPTRTDPIPIRGTSPPGRMRHGGYTPDEIAAKAREFERQGV